MGGASWPHLGSDAAWVPVLRAAGTTADAAKVKIYLGMPHYGYQVGPDYRFREGYGWYQYSGYNDNFNRGRLSCGEARARNAPLSLASCLTGMRALQTS